MPSTGFSFVCDLSGCLSNMLYVVSILQQVVPQVFNCSYVYLPDRSDALVQWAAERFSHACFLLYEQMHPEDPFGRVMQQHFSQLNSALRSLSQYPDGEAQQKRFFEKVSTCSPKSHGKPEAPGTGCNFTSFWELSTGPAGLKRKWPRQSCCLLW